MGVNCCTCPQLCSNALIYRQTPKHLIAEKKNTDSCSSLYDLDIIDSIDLAALLLQGAE